LKIIYIGNYHTSTHANVCLLYWYANEINIITHIYHIIQHILFVLLLEIGEMF